MSSDRKIGGRFPFETDSVSIVITGSTIYRTRSGIPSSINQKDRRAQNCFGEPLFPFTPDCEAVAILGQLLLNPNAEDALVSGNIPSWTETTGTTWTYRTTASVPTPQDGINYFFAGVNAVAELAQDISITDNNQEGLIDAGLVTYTFTGYVRAFEQTPPDASRILIEFIDGSNSILDSYDSGNIASSGSWQLVQDSRIAPSGTRIVRIKLIATRNSGTNNDGYFDNMSLVASI